MLLDQEFTTVPVESITPHPANPRRGDVAAITTSIEAHGFFGACVVQRSTSHILIGNHRWRAAQQAGEAQVPVLWVDVDNEQAKRIMVADNRMGEFAQWDNKSLYAALAEFADTDLGLDGIGFTEADLADLADTAAAEDRTTDDLLAALDVVMSDPRHVVAHGEVYQLEAHVLVIAKVTTEWPVWSRYLAKGVIFCPHPSPYLPLSTLADTTPLLLVTTDSYLAGHVLDKWEAAGRTFEKLAAAPR